MKNYWLYYVGIIGIVVTFLTAVTSFSHNTMDFQIPFLLIGVLLSLCITGLGKIITILESGDSK
ncbi:MAG TPA: hypothetical protein IAC84_01300 [Firmicutes bacterium]|nr:hypothetical protein [Bacillota bacterium]